jgi:4-hydroxy-tetrahydrodipicolinate synthase
MIDLISNARRLRPSFELLTGAEYLISAGAIGATGMFSPLAGIAPGAVRRLWDLCRQERYDEALPVQEALAALRQALKPWGVAGLKGAMRFMGRECGQPRPPLDPCVGDDQDRIAHAIGAIAGLKGEPQGW